MQFDVFFIFCSYTFLFNLGKYANKCENNSVFIVIFDHGGMIVLYPCAQLAVLHTYNCLLIMIYYRLGQNLLIINKYAVRSWYILWSKKLVKN